jgi:copper chaperone CopZ
MSDVLTLAIDGMHCGACVRRVRTALEKVPGVAVSDVAIGTATVTLVGAPRADVLAALEKAGYPARASAS